ncbi:MAG TPA: plasmid pRiA4b ORF-3 family protein [Tepidisphaeraceae bacterium]|jgi:hypothetical protein|nr:plasmid pRiA4b ORF-3 family protein [Tepidisphaeraceae bacterium]
MEDNLAPFLSPMARKLLVLFKQYDHDFDKLLAANPQISRAQIDQVTREVMSAMELVMGKPAPAKKWRRKAKGPANAYQIKMTLCGSKPPIWRRVVVPGDLTLEQLHQVIQMAMGWQECHLHQFEIGGETYTGIDEDYTPENGELDDSQYRLCDVIDREKTKFQYEYDFGDGWDHTMVVEKIIPAAENPKSMVCLAGKGRCPPEDCGGIWGYYRLLEILEDPSHEEHKDMMEWAGGKIDPTEFDADEVSSLLSDMRR